MIDKLVIESLRLHDSLVGELNELLEVVDLGNVLSCKYTVYLFGSFVKRCVKVTSDIDILVLLDIDEDDNKKLTKIRWELEDYISDRFRRREVDLKLYTKKRFDELAKNHLSFEQIINEYMVEVISNG